MKKDKTLNENPFPKFFSPFSVFHSIKLGKLLDLALCGVVRTGN